MPKLTHPTLQATVDVPDGAAKALAKRGWVNSTATRPPRQAPPSPVPDPTVRVPDVPEGDPTSTPEEG